MSGRVFVDTSAYYALTDSNETSHAAAQAVVQQLAHESTELYTTNFVIAETHTLILNRLGRDTAERVLDRLYASATKIIRATEGDERRAREIVHQYHDKEFSLIDAISFAVMERIHLNQTFTFDQHFAQFGFTLLR